MSTTTYDYIIDPTNPSQQILVTSEEAKQIRIQMLKNRIKRDLIITGVAVFALVGITIALSMMNSDDEEENEEDEESSSETTE